MPKFVQGWQSGSSVGRSFRPGPVCRSFRPGPVALLRIFRNSEGLAVRPQHVPTSEKSGDRSGAAVRVELCSRCGRGFPLRPGPLNSESLGSGPSLAQAMIGYRNRHAFLCRAVGNWGRPFFNEKTQNLTTIPERKVLGPFGLGPVFGLCATWRQANYSGPGGQGTVVC